MKVLINFSGELFESEIIAVKLCDFGVSKSISDTTLAHTNCGTLSWCSTEILAKKQSGYTKQTDIWSLSHF